MFVPVTCFTIYTTQFKWKRGDFLNVAYTVVLWIAIPCHTVALGVVLPHASMAPLWVF